MNKFLIAGLLAAGCNHYEENLGFSVVGETRWAISVGGRAQDRGMITTFDSIGDVVVCGDFIGPADFGSGLDGAGGPWPFITKRVASDGAERWTKRLLGVGAPSYVGIAAMAITPQDEIVVTGSYWGSVDFGGQVLTFPVPDPPDRNDMFVAKYASDGHLLWVRGLTDYKLAEGVALAIDAMGAIYATASVSHDGVAYQEVLLAYDGDGARRWQQVFQAATPPNARSIAIAPNGDVLVGGSFDSPTSFGGAVINPAARMRGFLARFRSDGLYLASSAVGPVAPYASRPPTIRIDAAGQIVLQQVEVDESQSPAWADLGSKVHVFDEAGLELWAAPIANHGIFAPQERALLTTPSGFIASAAWADHATTPTGEMEVVTFDLDGSNTLSTFGSRLVLAPDSGTFVFSGAVSSDGAIALTGQFGGMLDFGTGTMTTHGNRDADAFVVVVNPPAAGSR
jgi:hypothetical protein